MILIVCTDDPSLEQIARDTLDSNPIIYKSSYKIFQSQLRQLGQGEDLFVIAHGAFHGDNDLPVIGDEAKAFYVNGDTLYLNIKGIFPEGYKANVYIDACESANTSATLLSFTTMFYLDFHPDFSASKVYGITGVSDGLIPPPGDSTWVEVDLDNEP
ncbi:hypothetical protein [Hafnia psychrotolerans]|uniref:DUF4347 domain-containing protein n=1 Tax=Hafnia psychrotolerans TaxID=1477018 RepID=A0ABQ1GGI5_9GAMM|nr:hypothetical protein [Hafnia psychrotolerans]GGA43154.1 hypothetical protein GCM10011328_17690 [Hafnia psychrotolerans]